MTYENVKPEDYANILEEVREKYKPIHNELKHAFERGVVNEALESFGNEQNVSDMVYLSKDETDDIDGYELSYIEEELNALKERNSQHIGRNGFEITLISSAYEDRVEWVVFESSYTAVISDEKAERLFSRIAKRKIEDMIKPASASYSASVACRTFELWLSGDITTKAMVQMTYDSCGI